MRYARDPWAADALEVDPAEDVLLIGTGLTMCDVALALRDADHRGRIFALSRRGLRPQPHRVSAKPPPHLDPPADLAEWPNTALGLLRGLRAEARSLAHAGVDWREVVTSIRHDTPALWQRLDTDERRRFLDHLRPYWETHRHRASPEASHGVDEMIEAGRLEVIAGSVGGRVRGRGRCRRHAASTRNGDLRDPSRRQGDQLHRSRHRPGPRPRSPRGVASTGRAGPAGRARPRARHGRAGSAVGRRRTPEPSAVPRRPASQGPSLGAHGSPGAPRRGRADGGPARAESS